MSLWAGHSRPLITDIRHKSPDLFDTILPPSEKIEVIDDDELSIDGTSTRINTVIGGKIPQHIIRDYSDMPIRPKWSEHVEICQGLSQALSP